MPAQSWPDPPSSSVVAQELTARYGSGTGGSLIARVKGTPVVVFLHCALDDGGAWYMAGERDALAAKLAGY